MNSLRPAEAAATPPRILVEICVDSVVSAQMAARAGAGRLELCAEADVGGTTPAIDTLHAVLNSVGVPVFAMARPRAGDFVYDSREFDAMCRDIERLREAGAAGIVSGVLCRDRSVDRSRTAELVAAARPLPFTFHRAFDDTPDPRTALDVLLETGVARVLTSGGAPTALAGMSVIAELVRAAGDRLVVMAGGRVRATHATRLVAATSVREVHARPTLGDDPLGEIDPDAVRALVEGAS
ncbi:MAG TPA: copper homeostasis protein CutC [Gemmatimonadaceae bacterium]